MSTQAAQIAQLEDTGDPRSRTAHLGKFLLSCNDALKAFSEPCVLKFGNSLKNAPETPL